MQRSVQARQSDDMFQTALICSGIIMLLFTIALFVTSLDEARPRGLPENRMCTTYSSGPAARDWSMELALQKWGQMLPRNARLTAYDVRGRLVEEWGGNLDAVEFRVCWDR